jgi:GT2 family glycosyltransferase
MTSLASLPFLVLQHSGIVEHQGTAEIGIAVINFNTAAQTLRCLASLGQSALPPRWIVVLDNASSEDDFKQLLGCSALPSSELRIYRSTQNLGFAAGSNFLVQVLLSESHPTCTHIGLLNNDAVAMPDMLTLFLDALKDNARLAGMVGGRMHRLAHPDEVDTLGITLYASLMPADRKSTDDPYLGPTGGCCLITRECVDEIIGCSGYFFDSRYFCYCEDTDLVLRANLLGYQPAYVDQLVALHEGQASSSKRHHSFIAYHGLRNAIWMHWKFMPTKLVIHNAIWLLTAHGMTVARQVASGRLSTLWRLYRDAFWKLPEMLEERSRFQRFVRIAPNGLSKRISSRFYRKGYARVVLAELRKYWTAFVSRT